MTHLYLLHSLMSTYRRSYRSRDPIIIPYINTIDNPGPLYIAGVPNTYIEYTSGVVQNNQWYLATSGATISPGANSVIILLYTGGTYQEIFWDTTASSSSKNIPQGYYFVVVPGTSAGLVLDSQPLLSLYDPDISATSTSRYLLLNGAAKFFLTKAN